MRAWRAQVDTHVCPLVDVGKPHGGGVAAKGSATVMVGGMPAVRQGDQIQEAGPPNTIIMGCATVRIGG
jgi:uncharacterized Zn-binding protein involved in type VI secretion